MFSRFADRSRKILVGAVAAAVLAGAVAVVGVDRAEAHCDSATGPVVTAAREALEQNNVDLILPYVKDDAEAELTAVFNHAQEVRKLGGEAQALAERFFFETTVRLHRMGEGAGFTGIKESVEYDPALAASEEALKDGSVEEVYKVLAAGLHDKLEEKWHAVVETRKHAAEVGSVAANRERVEAELGFQIFAHETYNSIVNFNPHGEGAGAGGHEHGTAAGGHEAAVEDHTEMKGCPALTGSTTITLYFNGQRLDAPGVAHDQKLLVPVRDLAQAAGAEVSWDGHTQSVLVHKGDRLIILKVGDSVATVNGKQVKLPVAAELHDGRTFAPGHLLTEGLGLELRCAPEERSVYFSAH